MKKHLLAAVIFIICSTFTFSQNLDPDKLITQYIKTSWTSADGLLSDTVVDLMQDKNGFILIGTYDGLVKFDGIKFETVNKYTNTEFNSVSARVLLEDRNGDLWVGTNGDGLAYFHNKKVKMIKIKDGLPDESIRSLCEDREGRIWIGTTKGICFYKNGKIKRIGNKILNNNLIEFISCDRNGTVWTATPEKGLLKFDGNDFISYDDYKELKERTFMDLFNDSDGSFWFATKESGVISLKDGNLKFYNKSNGFEADKVNSIFKDDTGAMWFATDSGVIRIHKGKISVYNESSGLVNNIVEKKIQDREGNIWLATGRGGIEKLSAGKFLNITSANGLAHDTVNCVAQDKNGDIWIGTDSGLSIWSRNTILKNYITEYFNNLRIRNIYKDNNDAMWVSTYSDKGCVRFKDGIFKNYSEKGGLSGNRVRVTFQDSLGRIWIGTTNGLNLIRTDGSIKTYKRSDGLSNDYIMCIYENIDNNIWVGTDGGGINILDENGRFAPFSAKDGLSGNVVFKIYKDKSGIVWISTGSGVSRYDNGRITNFNVGNGLLNDSVFELLEDSRGKFWMTTSKGVFYVNKFDMNSYSKGNENKLKVVAYDKSDGLSSGVTATSWSAIDSTGKIWFSTLNGTAVIDPSNIILNTYPPLISIKEVLLDSSKVSATDKEVVVNPDNRRITINFTALSFSVPEKVLFRYKLDGFDKDFSEPTTLRSATYTNISPGKYKFKIKAANNDGIWTTEDAQIIIIQKPKFYQNIWFYIFLFIVIALSIYLIYRMRVKHLRMRQEELEGLVKMRTEDLVKEKEKSEELLLNILPQPIAERLKKGESTIADTFVDVTIIFADIVNFTHFSSQISASAIVYYLNSLFCEFDQLTYKYGIEKIKTIGDAYMAVAGLPQERADHAEVIADLALDMFNVLDKINKEMGIDLKIRIGINSGSVIAGVIGKRKFIYDLWGDAVNVASRMEHYGEADKIQISESTHKLISDKFVCEFRDEMDIKGKGVMKTYYLNRRKDV